ncbi:flagellar basal body rod protein FlgC [Izhakiella australiensis]|uniref:Flagellar basal-body rod protein FlgC n=1 Tax=Izhakiella australiensis TaxID=1926881 RepID=A0A1S8YI63_9GAMM|nr:flagellar basal body rod protein FlgC [Izhakiella australiensis]OON38754.1 flagellar basal body rod protein FlgC [Izhakiella australiensis]
MSFNNIYRISGSAMNAQTIRLNTIASNLANADTPAASAAATYKALSPVFSAVYNSGSQATSGARVQVLDVVESGGTVQRYEPGNPLADARGMVFYPDINNVEEMADMMSASRSFETSVEVLNSVKSMQQSLLRLGDI